MALIQTLQLAIILKVAYPLGDRFVSYKWVKLATVVVGAQNASFQ